MDNSTFGDSSAIAQHRLDFSTSSNSPSASDQEADQTIDAGSDSDSSSDDDAGIFFGQRTDAESCFLAKLSGSSTPSPSPSPSTPNCKRRQSRLVSRLRRDSTEFHRRKTMLFPMPVHDHAVDNEDEEEENDESRMTDRKMKERYQQEVSPSQVSPSALASTASPGFASLVSPTRLQNAFSGLCIAPSPTYKTPNQESEASDASSESDGSSDSGQSESDKENAGIAAGMTEGANGDLDQSFDFSISLGTTDQDNHFAMADSRSWHS
jgi:hypothetical protein